MLTGSSGDVCALYSPVIYQLYRSRWEMIDYTPRLLILPLSLFLIWKKSGDVPLRDRLLENKPLNPAVNVFAPSLIVLGLMMFIFGWKLDFLFITTISAIPLLFGVIIYLYGGPAAKTLSFPVLYLLLMVPPPLGVLDAITIPMRHGISVAAVAILNSLHYPVSREGLMIYLGGHEIFYWAPRAAGSGRSSQCSRSAYSTFT
jgi:exosortase